MAFRGIYRKQVALLLRALPIVTKEDIFALKGGTAINLFVRDMPRLSVDIDLTYLPIKPREESLIEIDAAMKRVSAGLTTSIEGARITLSVLNDTKTITKLIVKLGDAQIKIEITPVLRGCVFDSVLRRVSEKTEAEFGFAEARIVSFPDLYGGKLVAALDRQHPRDLFDVRDLLANEGLTDDLRKAFLVYLLSHDRPMSEVLMVRLKPLDQEFARSFDGMTEEPVSLDELAAARSDLVDRLIKGMPEEHRRFLVSFEKGEPQWDLLDIPHAKTLPAVLWRQKNLDKLDTKKRGQLISSLEAIWTA